jgi:hypothetical protein
MAYDEAIIDGYQIHTCRSGFEQPGVFDDVNFFLAISTPA